MVEKNQIIEGTIESIAFGGNGVLKHEGFVIFVPFTAPGDVVRVEITSQKKSFAEARIVDIITPSALRTIPPCPYYGTCGGCQLQHIQYEAQVEQKARFVNDAFEHLGKIHPHTPVACTASPKPWHYRRSITLSLRALDGEYRGGFVTHDKKDIVAIESCRLFSDDDILTKTQHMLKKLKGTPHRGDKLSIVKNGSEKYVLAFEFKTAFPKNIDTILGNFLAENDTIDGAVAYANEKVKHYANKSCSYTIDDLSIDFSPTAFVQTHPEQSAIIYHDIVDTAKQCGAKKILDLYCGIGVSTLLLAKEGMSVTGVEHNREAVHYAIENAHNNTISGAYFFRSDAAKAVEKQLEKQPDLVIINPPRTGVDATVLAALKHAWPKTIIYISCMPATLARDAAELIQRGYTLSSCKAYDMFPQTTHVETMIVLTRVIG